MQLDTNQPIPQPFNAKGRVKIGTDGEGHVVIALDLTDFSKSLVTGFLPEEAKVLAEGLLRMVEQAQMESEEIRKHAN